MFRKIKILAKKILVVVCQKMKIIIIITIVICNNVTGVLKCESTCVYAFMRNSRDLLETNRILCRKKKRGWFSSALVRGHDRSDVRRVFVYRNITPSALLRRLSSSPPCIDTYDRCHSHTLINRLYRYVSSGHGRRYVLRSRTKKKKK